MLTFALFMNKSLIRKQIRQEELISLSLIQQFMMTAPVILILPTVQSLLLLVSSQNARAQQWTMLSVQMVVMMVAHLVFTIF
jgi:hypothetical protein